MEPCIGSQRNKEEYLGPPEDRQSEGRFGGRAPAGGAREPLPLSTLGRIRPLKALTYGSRSPIGRAFLSECTL